GHTIERLGAGVHGDVFLVPVGLVLVHGHEPNENVVSAVRVDRGLQFADKSLRVAFHESLASRILAHALSNFFDARSSARSVSRTYFLTASRFRVTSSRSPSAKDRRVNRRTRREPLSLSKCVLRASWYATSSSSRLISSPCSSHEFAERSARCSLRSASTIRAPVRLSSREILRRSASRCSSSRLM